MARSNHRILLLALLWLLAALRPAVADETTPRPAAFGACLACHTTVPGKNAFGPSLFGVAGRKAASLQTYMYSKALQASGIVWDAETLDQWLSGPQKKVPGTKMPFPGISDAARRKQVVDYLLTLQ